MLRAPSPDVYDTRPDNQSVKQNTSTWRIENDLPFCPAAPNEISFFNAMISSGRDKSMKCMACSGKSDRCRRDRKPGSNYCKQHSDMAKGIKGNKLSEYHESLKWIFNTLSKIKVFDEELTKTKQASLLEYYKNERLHQGRLRILNSHLMKRKLHRVEIPGDGNCQFEAVVKAAKLGVTGRYLRLEVCNYLKQFPTMFENFADGNFANYDAYIDYMRSVIN